MIIPGLLLATLLLVIAGALRYIAGAAAYDIHEINRLRRVQKHPYAKNYRARPLVTVLVYAHNDELSVVHCLESLQASKYRKLEIIVVDAMSHDKTRQLIRQFAPDHEHMPIRMVAKRTPSTKNAALLAAYRKYGHGEIVVSMDATDSLDRPVITKAVGYLNSTDNIDGLLPRLNIITANSVIGVWQNYQQMVRAIWNKSPRTIGNSMAVSAIAMWRRNAFLKSASIGKNNSNPKFAYCQDFLINRSHEQSLNKWLKLCYKQQKSLLRQHFVIRLATVLIALSMSYLLYLAIRLKQPSLLMLVLAAVALFVLYAVWSSSGPKLHKIKYLLGVPLAYPLLIVLGITQIIAGLRVIVVGQILRIQDI